MTHATPKERKTEGLNLDLESPRHDRCSSGLFLIVLLLIPHDLLVPAAVEDVVILHHRYSRHHLVQCARQNACQPAASPAGHRTPPLHPVDHPGTGSPTPLRHTTLDLMIHR
jgi:hypothetical protein